MLPQASRTLIFTSILIFIQLFSQAFCETPYLPEVLKPWSSWVLEGHEAELCPVAYNNAHQKFCIWPGRLSLTLHDAGGTFTQSVTVYAKSHVPLPGNVDVWPQNVKINEIATPVVQYDQTPTVFLDAGAYEIKGEFSWHKLPDTLNIGLQTGLIDLTVNQNHITQPDRELSGQLWLHEKTTLEPQEQDSLHIKVFRKITDAVPMLDTVLCRLQVSGKPREVVIGPLLLKGATPFSLNAPLPTRLEPDGKLRIQLKPGTWEVILTSRFLEDIHTFTKNLNESPWPSEEIWVFESNSSLRLQDIQAPTPLDPQQTDLPQNWRNFPTFLMHNQDRLTLTEVRRGQESKKAPDLTLSRNIWLDFSGNGYTVLDNLSGVLPVSRLEMQKPFNLGRITNKGQNQLITQLPPKGLPGVEVRQGQIELEAASRIESPRGGLPATGWDINVKSLSTVLHIPPGWLLVHAKGADRVQDSWLGRWTLLDLFLILIIAASAYHLLGKLWGPIALITLTLIYHESGAPIFSWLNLLAIIALLSVFPANAFKKYLFYYFILSVASWSLISLPFMANQIRNAIFPQLSAITTFDTAMPRTPKHAILMQDRAMTAPKIAQEAVQEKSRMVQGVAKEILSPLTGQNENLQSIALPEYDPKATVQTGPGIPDWQGTNVMLDWNGPVLKSQTLQLWLLPAWGKSIVNCIQAALVFIFGFALVLFGLKTAPTRFREKMFPKNLLQLFGITVLALGIFGGTFPQDILADIPEQDLRSELKDKLLAPPKCLENCADLNTLRINLIQNQLTLTLAVHALDKVALPLPGTLGQWIPDAVLLDGITQTNLQIAPNGQLWLLAEPGVHEVLLEGKIGSLDRFDLFLPLKPHYVQVTSLGWNVGDFSDNHLEGNVLHFSKLSDLKEEAQISPSASQNFPNFVEVTRTFQFGLNWEIHTTVQRKVPTQGSFIVKVPLLTGESVLSDNISVIDQIAHVSFQPNQQEVTWVSKFDTIPELLLEASLQTDMVEKWQIVASPIWHIETIGIPPIHEQTPAYQWLPQFSPWPGETLSIQISRPTPTLGNTFTLDNSYMLMQPGQQAEDVALNFTVRTSQATTQEIQIPKNAEIQDVRINNLSQPINASQGKVLLSLVPGTQEVSLLWRIPQGLQLIQKFPSVKLSAPSVNHIQQVNLPQNRWVLFVKGPLLGPAILFWGALVIMILVAILLGKSKLTPLSIWQWFLLGLGLLIATPMTSVVVVLWFFCFKWRENLSPTNLKSGYNLTQIFLVILTFLFLSGLITTITQGLLGTPQMQISQPYIPRSLNDSAQSLLASFNPTPSLELTWYQDIAQSELPKAWVLSLPMVVYRIFMLLWALWLAFSVITWLKWGWHSFSKNGLWFVKEK